MKKLIPIFILVLSIGLFSSPSHAEWITISGDPDKAIEFSYHSEDIVNHEGTVRLWVRQRTQNEATKSQIEINCAQNTVTLMMVYFFNDRNWTKQGKINDVPHTAYIPTGSSLDILAADLCEW